MIEIGHEVILCLSEVELKALGLGAPGGPQSKAERIRRRKESRLRKCSLCGHTMLVHETCCYEACNVAGCDCQGEM